MGDDLGRVPTAPGSQATPSAAVPASSPVGADPSRILTQCSSCPYRLPGDIARCPLCPEDKHEMTIVSTGVFDEAVCSCGWSSEMYWDAPDLAEKAWRKHVRDSDGSPKGGDGEAGSVRSTTARPEGIAQKGQPHD